MTAFKQDYSGNPSPVSERSFVLEDADVVTPNGILKAASLKVEEGRVVEIKEGTIAAIGPRINCDRNLLMPGIIDVHSDALEKYVEPRPKSMFPLPAAILNFERTLITYGITTMYHCVSALKHDIHGRIAREKEVAFQVLHELNRLKPLMLTQAKVHFRYDMLHSELLPDLKNMIADGLIDLLSIMDHTPGQGQFSDKEEYLERMEDHTHSKREEFEMIVEDRIRAHEARDDTVVESLIATCLKHGIAVASHDDDSIEKVNWVRSMGVTISEFPVNETAAREASEHNMAIAFGSPNVLRGKSLSGNISAKESIKKGMGSVLCSDYAPMSLLHAVFLLSNENLMSMEQAVNMVSLNPARAVGIAEETGSIEIGKAADLILVECKQEVPLIKKTIVYGREVFSVN